MNRLKINLYFSIPQKLSLKNIYKCLILLGFFIPRLGYSHLVSYEDGIEFMTEHMGDRTQMSLIYSPKWWLGVGLMYDKALIKDFDGDVYSAMVSVLLKRWNLSEAQGNIYTFIAPGFLQNRIDNQNINGDYGILKYGLRADYETRRFYIAAEYMEVLSLKGSAAASDKRLLDNFMVAFGVAPFIANYQDLNVWFLTKVQFVNEYKNVEIFPTARFFYKNVLWEVGQSLKGQSLFSFMMRF